MEISVYMLVYNGKKFIIFYACYTKYKKKRVRCLSNSFFNVFLNIYFVIFLAMTYLL